MWCEPGFWEAVAARAHATSHSVTVTAPVAELVLTVPSPQSVASIIGSTLTLTQVSEIGAPDPAGVRPVTVSVQVAGMPVNVRAKGDLVADQDDSVLSISGELAVRIPILGKKIEAAAAPFIQAALDGQAEVAAKWLKEH